MRRSRLVATVALGALALASFGGLRASAAVVPTQYTMSDVASTRGSVFDPGAPPPFNPEDYPGSLRSGTNTLVGKPFVRLVTGQTLACGSYSGAWVFPDTPYVRWMVQKWLYRVATAGEFTQPSDGLSVEPALDPYNKGTIVVGRNCDEGAVVFHNLPDGKYFVLAEIRPLQHVTWHASPIVNVPFPDSDEMHVEQMDGQPISAMVPMNDEFFLGASVSFTRPNATFVLPDASWGTYAHTSFDSTAYLKRYGAARKR